MSAFSFAYDTAQFNKCNQIELLKIESSYVLKVNHSVVGIPMFIFTANHQDCNKICKFVALPLGQIMFVNNYF